MDELRSAASNGVPAAQFVLGDSLFYGRNVATNPVEAAVWFRKAADQNHPVAQFNLGMMYEDGIGVAKDQKEALNWYRRSAELGFAAAQFNLGMCFARGEGVTQDLFEAVRWYRAAAIQGDVSAGTHLGIALRDGRGATRDLVEAADWFRRSAYSNDPYAQFALGAMYFRGEAGLRDTTNAFRWFQRSAEGGSVDGMYMLGMALLGGEGVNQNVTAAVRVIRQAADRGHPLAMYRLAACLLDGVGVAADVVEGTRLLKQAAEKGEPNAQLRLGHAYQSGLGVERDDVEAQKWLASAAEQGFGVAERLHPNADALPSGTISNLIANPAPSNPVPAINTSKENAVVAEPPPFDSASSTSKNEQGKMAPASAPNSQTATIVDADLPPREAVRESTTSNTPGVMPRQDDGDSGTTYNFHTSPKEMAAAGAPVGLVARLVPWLMAGVCLVVLFVFNSRLRSLEARIQEARVELERANKSLSVMARAVESRLLAAESAPQPAPVIARAPVPQAQIPLQSETLSQFKAARRPAK